MSINVASDPEYGQVILRAGEHYRIAATATRWLLQRHNGQRIRPWRTIASCKTRAELMAAARSRSDAPDGLSPAIETALPAVHAGEKKRAPGKWQAGYQGVVVEVNGQWRLIDDPSGLQWILQGRRNGRWRDEAFCRDRREVLLAAQRLCGYLSAGERAGLDDLPARFNPKRPA